MEKILLVGHGSPKGSANQMESLGMMLHEAMHPGCSLDCVYTAYLQFAEPDLPSTIERALASGATRLIVHPYFLSAGNHVSVDIPEIIESYRKSSPHVEFIYTGPLGVSDRLIRLVVDRIREASHAAPSDIERESFRRLAEEGDFTRYPLEFHPIVKRVVHATADFSFIDTLMFHPGAVSAGVGAIRAGKDILVDVEMVRAGINKAALARWGGRVLCRIGDAQAGGGRTRAEAAMASGLTDDNVGIVAVGNAPTALYKCIEIINSGRARPNLVVGVPVGFVRAAESKALLVAQAFPFISNAGRRGGTPAAVAIVNALMKIAGEDNG